MLDAADGEPVRTVVVVPRVHSRRIEVQVAAPRVSRRVRRRRPITTVRADVVQTAVTGAIADTGSCLVIAIAGMNAAEEVRETNSATGWNEQLTPHKPGNFAVYDLRLPVDC